MSGRALCNNVVEPKRRIWNPDRSGFINLYDSKVTARGRLDPTICGHGAYVANQDAKNLPVFGGSPNDRRLFKTAFFARYYDGVERANNG